MKIAFLAAMIAMFCAEGAIAEEKAWLKTDNLIRRKLEVGTPSDPKQIANETLAEDCKKTNTCPSEGPLPVVRPQVRKLLEQSQ
ncbi:hypothetical protein [Ciceribacter azotifigens]|uniref:hypothetical protein n=1 Tax=Ciceribacter azotifigens TaxID=2069303 RepID=UPI003A883185